ncbi:MAG TPA: hypothetical protein VGS41_01045 [Chthonomonadales bacterium]|nr:hypothetical protein [Chthonomonadales bacterium]
MIFAIFKTAETGEPNVGRVWLRQEVPTYWERRTAIVELLRYLAQTPTPFMR